MRTTEAPSLCVIGNGYVGTVVAASFAFLGREVVGLEADAAKLRVLRAGRAPFHEPGLDELLQHGLERGRLAFTDDPEEAVASSRFVFLCVGSPSGPDGSADLGPLESAGADIAPWVGSGHVLVIKTTVPVGTNARMRALVRRAAGLDASCAPSVVSNPEFLRQGTAVWDFLHPDRIVLGAEDDEAIERVAGVYRPILEQGFPGSDPGCRPVLVRTTPAVAEAAKYAANAFLAAKVSFMNELANILDPIGADIDQVARVIGLDHRIGPQYLRAGLGWGGSCFTKDLDQLIVSAEEVGYVPRLLAAVRAINQGQPDVVIAKLRRHLDLDGARVALLGLSFKPGTDDLRGAPAVELARRLRNHGAVVSAFDPVVRGIPELPDVRVTDDVYEAVDGADAALVVTDWPELRRLDLASVKGRMRGGVLVDGRNVIPPGRAAQAGLVYEGMGRGGTTAIASDPRAGTDGSGDPWETRAPQVAPVPSRRAS